MKCDRCRKETSATIMSKFNTQEICPECEELETLHPRYAEADRAETRAVLNGDTNFPGIGLPEDLI